MVHDTIQYPYFATFSIYIRNGCFTDSPKIESNV